MYNAKVEEGAEIVDDGVEEPFEVSKGVSLNHFYIDA